MPTHMLVYHVGGVVLRATKANINAVKQAQREELVNPSQ